MSTESGDAFHRAWLRRLRGLRRDLQSARWAHPSLTQSHLDRLVAHFDSSRNRRDDVLSAFAAQWATPLERAVAFWFGGWRPTTLIHVLYTESGRRLEAQLLDILLGTRTGNLGDLSPAQVAQIDELQSQTIREEEEVEQEYFGRVLEEMGEAEVEGIVGCVERVLGRAHEVRMSSLRRAVEPAQAAELQVGFHELGVKHAMGSPLLPP